MVCIVGLLLYTILYTTIQYLREVASQKKEKLSKWNRYRLNDYFIIQKSFISNKMYLYMDMSLKKTTRNYYYCLLGRRTTIYKGFSKALTNLSTSLTEWGMKCNYDLYFKTNENMMKRLNKFEKSGKIEIKEAKELTSKAQILERISICNEDRRKQKLYNVVLKITQKGT